MKVVHVFKSYLPEDFTGIPRVIHAIAEGLRHSGVESHVLSLFETDSKLPLKIDGHSVHQAKRDVHLASTSLSLSAFGKFRDLARTADIVHYHFPWPQADALHLLYGRGKPALVTYHSDIVKQRYLSRLYRPLMNRFLKEVDEIVATSPNYAETSSVLARYRSKVSIVPIGLPERTPPKKADLEKWQTQVGMEFFLFVGTLRYYKGLPFLTEAARQTGLPVVIVGNRDRGRVARGDIAPNVKFLGAIPDPDKEALLSLCRGFVFPSHLRSEAFGIALLEAARAGKPMISCEIGTGTSYVNADGETGLIVPPADANALGHAMWRLSNNPEEAKQMGARARTRFERLFKSEDMCAAYLKLYKGLIAARRP